MHSCSFTILHTKPSVENQKVCGCQIDITEVQTTVLHSLYYLALVVMVVHNCATIQDHDALEHQLQSSLEGVSELGALPRWPVRFLSQGMLFSICVGDGTCTGHMTLEPISKLRSLRVAVVLKCFMVRNGCPVADCYQHIVVSDYGGPQVEQWSR